MATNAIPAPIEPENTPPKRRLGEGWMSPLMLAPSVIALIVFIYGFIGMTFWISISNWRKAGPMDISISDPWWGVYDRLFNDPHPDAGGKNFLDALNADSKRVVTAYLEPGLREAKAEDRFQFERHGYFVADRVDSQPGRPVFNRIVGLKDSWGK